MKSVSNAETNQPKLYLAPMEGITGYVYRNAYDKYFTRMDKYFTPFISPNQNRGMNPKEKNDILPEHNEGLSVVPQILTNNAQYFIHTAKELQQFGYQEVNLNLGCPSQTVAAKGKGAGFLSYPLELEQFLGEIYDRLDMKISIKTRLGRENPQEFESLLKLYQKFPVYELIIHPRVQKDFYKNTARLDVYTQDTRDCQIPLCYNGDIVNVETYHHVLEEAGDNTQAVMLGRGLIANPFLPEQIQKGTTEPNIWTTREKLEGFMAFMEEVEQGYTQIISGDRNVMFRMKEIWYYCKELFPDCKKQLKQLNKATRLEDYHNVLQELTEIIAGRIENPVV